MTHKQYQGFFRALRALADKTIQLAADEKRSKEDVVADVKEMAAMLQDMLEDGS